MAVYTSGATCGTASKLLANNYHQHLLLRQALYYIASRSGTYYYINGITTPGLTFLPLPVINRLHAAPSITSAVTHPARR